MSVTYYLDIKLRKKISFSELVKYLISKGYSPNESLGCTIYDVFDKRFKLSIAAPKIEELGGSCEFTKGKFYFSFHYNPSLTISIGLEGSQIYTQNAKELVNEFIEHLEQQSLVSNFSESMDKEVGPVHINPDDFPGYIIEPKQKPMIQKSHRTSNKSGILSCTNCGYEKDIFIGSGSHIDTMNMKFVPMRCNKCGEIFSYDLNKVEPIGYKRIKDCPYCHNKIEDCTQLKFSEGKLDIKCPKCNQKSLKFEQRYTQW